MPPKITERSVIPFERVPCKGQRTTDPFATPMLIIKVNRLKVKYHKRTKCPRCAGAIPAPDGEGMSYCGRCLETVVGEVCEVVENEDME